MAKPLDKKKRKKDYRNNITRKPSALGNAQGARDTETQPIAR